MSPLLNEVVIHLYAASHVLDVYHFKITALTEELQAVQSSHLHSTRVPLFNHVITQTKRLTLVKYH